MNRDDLEDPMVLAILTVCVLIGFMLVYLILTEQGY